MSNYKNLNFEKKEHIAIITINHPPANTWNLDTMTEFETAINQVKADDDIRVIIITGQGEKCFSAGFDVSDAKNASVTSPKGRELWQKLDRLSKPTIAAINGHALGGGLELAASCHFRIMVDSPDVRVGLTELNLGIIPGWGGTQRLTRLVGRATALDMILFSKRFNGAEALDMGLVDRLSKRETLMADALEFAEKLAERPPVAVRCVLDAFTAGLYEGLEKGLNVEAEGSMIVRDTEDKTEGFKAFLEKRKPVFQGK